MLKEHPQDRVICLDKLTYAGNLSTLAPVMDQDNFRFIKADICDRDAVYQLFEEEHPDVVVNLRRDRMSTGLLRIRRFSWKRISWGRLAPWMPAASTVFSGIIRYRRMKFMAICPWTGRICSLRKRRRSTRPVRIVPPRLRAGPPGSGLSSDLWPAGDHQPLL